MTAEAPKSPPCFAAFEFQRSEVHTWKSNEERLQDLLAYVDSLTRVHPSEIPGIDLYMDQVTTFMDSHLNTSKWLGEDKILTKTMINNYAKKLTCCRRPSKKSLLQESSADADSDLLF